MELDLPDVPAPTLAAARRHLIDGFGAATAARYALNFDDTPPAV